jgi:L-gulonolactone oxidase
VPAFTLRGIDSTEPLESVFERLDQLVAANEHFEFYSFPHSDTSWTRTNNRVDEAPRPRSRASEWFHEDFLVNKMFRLVCRTGRRFPRTIPTFNKLSAALSGGGERVDRSYRIFASPRHVRFTESEYAIPRAHVVDVVKEIRRAIDTHRYDVPFPIEIRFVASDDALLSPASGRETAYVAVHMFEKMPWEPYLSSVAAIAREVGGRPHWGKRHFESAETLRPLYPEWDRFVAVRERCDRDGTFANDHVRRVLGPP